MGGIGSGNYRGYRTKGTVDNARRIDIRYLNCQGVLASDYFNLSWTRNGETTSNVGLRVVAGISVTVICKWRSISNGEWLPFEKTILLAHTACTFGGSRPWFVCPDCHRRIAVVILDLPRIACRHCLNLTYVSRNKSTFERNWKNAHLVKD
jgi:hypothetical protein